MTYKKIDILDWDLPDSHIRIRDPRLDEIFAAHWSQMTIDAFDKLEKERRVELIAAYRMEKRIDSVLAFYRKPPKPKK